LIWKRRHEPTLAPLRASFTISAFCASSERSRAEIAQKYPGAPFVTDYRAFVQRKDVDAVVVLTPIN
jgi:predicted dehydrogenase